MEFETNTPVTDDARLLAQAKKVTLQPVHTDVSPDEMPDAVVVANHLRQGALANASNDIEQDSRPIAAATDSTAPAAVHHGPRVYILTAAGFVALAVVIFIVAFTG